MAKNLRQLPIVVDIPQPCAADWAAMPGDARVRHCAVCDKDVHALSELSEASMLSLLARANVCVRLQVAPDGGIVHRDHVAGKRAARVVATAALVALAACSTAEPSVNTPPAATRADATPAIAGSVAVAPELATEPIPSARPHLLGRLPLRVPPASATSPTPPPRHLAGAPVMRRPDPSKP